MPEHPGTPRKPGTPPRKPETPPRKPGTPQNLIVKTCKMLRIPLRIETKKPPGADEEAENSKRLDMLSLFEASVVFPPRFLLKFVSHFKRCFWGVGRGEGVRAS